MRILSGLLILGLFFSSVIAEAQPYRRLVNFEWEPIEGATSYELEIKQARKEGQTFNFKQKESAWNGRLAPGPYTMRVRALDYRKVPGEWSEVSSFEVGLEAAKLLFPAPKAKFAGKEAEQTEIEFRWAPVPGALTYQFAVQSSEGFKEERTLKEPRVRIKVPVAQEFSWQVNALGPHETKSEAMSVAEFTLLGPQLQAPRLSTPENEFVREVTWTEAPYASGYDVAVARLNTADRKWEKVEVFENVTGTSLPFPSNWKGGLYKVQVRAKSNRRASSPLAENSFKVRSGDRSPASEFTHEVRKSIDRINGWYGIASYLITQVQYSSAIWDGANGRGTSYNAIGGTGRLGLGHFRENKSWGFLGIVDMSGFMTNDDKNITYMSAEGSAVWRRAVGERGEFRSQLGMYYKEHLVAQGEGANTQVSSYAPVAVAGPHVSGEYWYSITPKLGIQANMHFYYGMLTMSTPNGEAVDPTMSTQMGIMGSYRFNRRFTGLVGYTRREDKIRYKSTPTNPANAGRINEASLEGNYINFFAEYSF